MVANTSLFLRNAKYTQFEESVRDIGTVVDTFYSMHTNKIGLLCHQPELCVCVDEEIDERSLHKFLTLLMKSRIELFFQTCDLHNCNRVIAIS